MLLAIDTANEYAGLALYWDGQLLAERTWRSGRSHSEQVLPLLDELLERMGAGPDALRALAVTLGPGSWSGVRVGLSLAKGLAVAKELPIIGVSGLEVLAYPLLWSDRPVYALARLGRDRYASARFERGERWSQSGPPQNLALEELVAALAPPCLVCGELDQRLAAALSQAYGERVALCPAALNVRRAGYLAEIAWARHCAGDYDDLVALEPIYLGHPVKARI